MLQLTFLKDGTRSSTAALRTSAAHNNVHKGDVAHFTQVGFEALVQLLADRQGFQPDVIRTVYRYLASYEETVEVIEAMREAAEEHAVAKILSRTEEEDVEDDSARGDNVKEDSVKEEEE